MLPKVENEYGVICIDNEVVSRIAGTAATECYGIVGMASKNVKDGIVQLLKIDNLTRGVKLIVNEDSVVFDLHIIVEYGTNISAIADTVMSTVKYQVEEQTGINVEQVNIFVEGIRVDN